MSADRGATWPCHFHDKNMCGFVNVGQVPTHWMRACQPGDHYVVLRQCLITIIIPWNAIYDLLCSWTNNKINCNKPVYYISFTSSYCIKFQDAHWHWYLDMGSLAKHSPTLLRSYHLPSFSTTPTASTSSLTHQKLFTSRPFWEVEVYWKVLLRVTHVCQSLQWSKQWLIYLEVVQWD